MNFVFDLDGTLCFSGKPITAPLVAALQEVEQKGHQVFFASARTIRDMLPVIDPSLHHHGMIGGNGSLGYQQGHLLFSESFTPPLLAEVKSLMERFNASYLADGDWDYAYTGPKDHYLFPHIDINQAAKNLPLGALNPIVKILILSSSDLQSLYDSLKELPVALLSHNQEPVIDINPLGVSKWSGLKKMGLQANRYIAFGNDSNDLPMFRNAHYSVMVGDHPDLKPWADDSIPTHPEANWELIIADKIRSLL